DRAELLLVVVDPHHVGGSVPLTQVQDLGGLLWREQGTQRGFHHPPLFARSRSIRFRTYAESVSRKLAAFFFAAASTSPGSRRLTRGIHPSSLRLGISLSPRLRLTQVSN